MAPQKNCSKSSFAISASANFWANCNIRENEKVRYIRFDGIIKGFCEAIEHYQCGGGIATDEIMAISLHVLVCEGESKQARAWGISWSD